MGDQYVVSYEDDTGTHERSFASKREAKQFRAAVGRTGNRRAPDASIEMGGPGGVGFGQGDAGGGGVGGGV